MPPRLGCEASRDGREANSPEKGPAGDPWELDRPRATAMALSSAMRQASQLALSAILRDICGSVMVI
jgi:hypothetical protein